MHVLNIVVFFLTEEGRRFFQVSRKDFGWLIIKEDIDLVV